MGLLGSPCGGVVLAHTGVVRSVIVCYICLCSVDCETGQIGGVGTHIGDESALVELLGHCHCAAHRHVELPGRLLLEGGGGERGGRGAYSVFLLNGTYPEFGVDAALQEGAGLFDGFEAAVEKGSDQHSLRGIPGMEEGFYAVIWLRPEGDDLALAVHHQSQGHGLYAAGGETGLNLPPQQRRELVADQAVEHPAGLLGIDQVHIYGTRGFNRVEYRVPGDFVKDYPAGAGRVESEHLGKVPGNGLSLAVFIGCEPYDVRSGGRPLQILYHPALGCRYFIFRLEAVCYIYAFILVGKVADVAETGFHSVAVAKKFLNGPRFRRRLDYNKVSRHILQFFICRCKVRNNRRKNPNFVPNFVVLLLSITLEK